MANAVATRLDKLLRDGFADEDSPLYRRVNVFIVLLIFFSVVCIVLDSVPSIHAEWNWFFEWSEWIVVGLFTLEYAINIYVAENRKGYIFGLWGIIDLLAILPSILLMLDLRGLKVGRILRILRFLRLMRILRVLKLAKIAARQFERRKENKLHTLKMDLQIYLIALFSAVTIFSTLAFYAEEGQANTAFTSIPAAMWWCIVTITTTGYGDMYPATVPGRIVAAMTMITGLALFGLLMNVVGKAMLTSLFGSEDLEAHHKAPLASEPLEAEGETAPEAVSTPLVAVCGCGQPLSPIWRLCPMCGTPTTRAMR